MFWKGYLKIYSRSDLMSKINSNRKGKDGELEFVNIFKGYGFENAQRSQQYCGANHDADVIGIPGLHIEVKRVERLNIDNAMDQCHRDKREEELGVVAHRKNQKDWIISMKLDDWMEIYKRYLLTIK